MPRTNPLPTWLNRRTVIAAAIIVGGVSVVALLAVWLSSAMTRQHYQDAAAETNKVVGGYNAMVAADDAYSLATKTNTTTDTALSEVTERYRVAYDAYIAQVAQLQNGWAVSDQAVQAAYGAFIEKHDAFVAASIDRTAVMSALRQVTLHCREQTLGAMDTSDLAKLSEAYDKTFTPCTSAITVLASSKNTTAAAVGKASASYFSDVKARAEAMQSSYNANDRAKFEAEYKQFLSLAESLKTYTDMSKIYAYYRDIPPGDKLILLTQSLAAKTTEPTK